MAALTNSSCATMIPSGTTVKPASSRAIWRIRFPTMWQSAPMTPVTTVRVPVLRRALMVAPYTARGPGMLTQ